MMNKRSNDIAGRVRQKIRDAALYHVPDLGDVIKLDANENPFSWPSHLESKWLETLRGLDINRYPDAPSRALCDTVRRVWQVPDGYDVLIGNGSDELIQIVEMGLAGPGGVVMAPDPTFVVYEHTAKLLGANYLRVPLDENFQIDEAVFLDQIEKHDPDCIFLATPNNPTANSFQHDVIDRIAGAADGLVVVDEAYGMFAKTQSFDRLDRFDNVVIMRTLSKVGFAGLRVGVLIGRPDWINELHKVRMPYNINSLSQASAIFALEHATEFDAQVAAIVDERERLLGSLSTIDGFHVYPSDANFILVRATGPNSAVDIHRHLIAGGIAVKNLDRADTPLANCLRITVGTPAENDRLIQRLSALA